MSEMVFEILKAVVVLAVMLVTTYLIPWLQAVIGKERLAIAQTWATAAVLMAQQVHDGKTGPERKEIVIDKLRDILIKKNIDMSYEQMDILVEAAVKVMKMQEEAAKKEAAKEKEAGA